MIRVVASLVLTLTIAAGGWATLYGGAGQHQGGAIATKETIRDGFSPSLADIKDGGSAPQNLA